jgi:hypothetical protein
MAASMIRSAGRSALTTILLAALLAAFGACGAPEYDYVTNSSEHVYFKVPHTWRKVEPIAPETFTSPVDPASGEAAVRDAARTWQVAYDSDSRGDKPDVLFGNEGKPFVYAQVRTLTESERNAMSINGMRDAFLPVTEDGRTSNVDRDAKIVQALQAGELSLVQAQFLVSGLSGFELLADQVMNPGDGIKAVRTVFNYYDVKYSDVLHTFDQTVQVSADGSHRYLFVISSAAAYYREHFDQLDAIATSFTVRSS